MRNATNITYETQEKCQTPLNAAQVSPRERNTRGHPHYFLIYPTTHGHLIAMGTADGRSTQRSPYSLNTHIGRYIECQPKSGTNNIKTQDARAPAGVMLNPSPLRFWVTMGLCDRDARQCMLPRWLPSPALTAMNHGCFQTAGSVSQAKNNLGKTRDHFLLRINLINGFFQEWCKVCDFGWQVHK